MPIVSIPDKKMVVQFPETMSGEEIEQAIRKHVYGEDSEQREWFWQGKFGYEPKGMLPPYERPVPDEEVERIVAGAPGPVRPAILPKIERPVGPPFDPEGAGYDYESAISAGLGPDETGHWPSRVPQTGLLLKGRKHPTWTKTEEAEKKGGYNIIKRGGRYYSIPPIDEKEIERIVSGEVAPMPPFGIEYPQLEAREPSEKAFRVGKHVLEPARPVKEPEIVGLGALQKPMEKLVDWVVEKTKDPKTGRPWGVEEEMEFARKNPNLAAARYAIANIFPVKLVPGLLWLVSPSDWEEFKKKSMPQQQDEIIGEAIGWITGVPAVAGGLAIFKALGKLAAAKIPALAWIDKPLGKIISEMDWFRRLTNRERSLVVQSIDQMKSAGWSDAEILKGLRSQPEEFNKFYRDLVRQRGAPPGPPTPPPAETGAPPRPGPPPTKPLTPQGVEADRPGNLALRTADGTVYQSKDPIHALMLDTFNIRPEDVAAVGLVTKEGRTIWDEDSSTFAKRLGMDQETKEQARRQAGERETIEEARERLGKIEVERRAREAEKRRKLVESEFFMDWLVGSGGVNPADATFKGELRDISQDVLAGRKVRAKGIPPGFFNKEARSIDERVTDAIEGGWLPEGATEQDFMDLIDREIEAIRALGPKPERKGYESKQSWEAAVEEFMERSRLKRVRRIGQVEATKDLDTLVNEYYRQKQEYIDDSDLEWESLEEALDPVLAGGRAEGVRNITEALEGEGFREIDPAEIDAAIDEAIEEISVDELRWRERALAGPKRTFTYTLPQYPDETFQIEARSEEDAISLIKGRFGLDQVPPTFAIWEETPPEPEDPLDIMGKWIDLDGRQAKIVDYNPDVVGGTGAYKLIFRKGDKGASPFEWWALDEGEFELIERPTRKVSISKAKAEVAKRTAEGKAELTRRKNLLVAQKTYDKWRGIADQLSTDIHKARAAGKKWRGQILLPEHPSMDSTRSIAEAEAWRDLIVQEKLPELAKQIEEFQPKKPKEIYVRLEYDYGENHTPEQISQTIKAFRKDPPDAKRLLMTDYWAWNFETIRDKFPPELQEEFIDKWNKISGQDLTLTEDIKTGPKKTQWGGDFKEYKDFEDEVLKAKKKVKPGETFQIQGESYKFTPGGQLLKLADFPRSLAKELYGKMNESERAGAKAGLFPKWVDKFRPTRETLAEIIRIASEQKGKPLEKKPPKEEPTEYSATLEDVDWEVGKDGTWTVTIKGPKNLKWFKALHQNKDLHFTQSGVRREQETWEGWVRDPAKNIELSIIKHNQRDAAHAAHALLMGSNNLIIKGLEPKKKPAKKEPSQKEPWEMTYREFADLFEDEYGGAKYTFAARVGEPLGIKHQAGEAMYQKRITEGVEQPELKWVGEEGSLPRDRWRKAIVRKALEQGKAVPDEVLKDYPDLKPPEPKEIHIFEKAGLGKAPFKFVGYEEKVFKPAPGAPTKPGSSCDFCGTAIRNVYWIKSADGKRFKVGSECVRKTKDRGLRKIIDEAVKKRREEKAATKYEADKKILGRALELHREELSAKAHPSYPGKTFVDYIEFMREHGGRSGTAALAKQLLKDYPDLKPPEPEAIEKYELYQSGISRPNDLQPFIAAKEPITVIWRSLSKKSKKYKPTYHMVKDYAKAGGRVLIDSGTFSGKVDWDKYMSWLEEFMKGIPAENNVRIVAPDIINDQGATLKLIDKYGERLGKLAEKAEIVVPIQMEADPKYNPIEFLNVARRLMGKLATPAIPMKKGRWTDELIEGLFGDPVQTPRNVHLLGTSTSLSRTQELIRKIEQLAPGTTITMDATKLRTKLKEVEEVRKRIVEERLEEEFDETEVSPKEEAIEDDVEYAEHLRKEKEKVVKEGIGPEARREAVRQTVTKEPELTDIEKLQGRIRDLQKEAFNEAKRYVEKVFTGKEAKPWSEQFKKQYQMSLKARERSIKALEEQIREIQQGEKEFFKPPPPPEPPTGNLFGDAGGYSTNVGKIIELPEIVQLAKELLGGRYPKIVRRILRTYQVKGAFYPVGSGRISIRADLFEDPAQAAAVLAHEIGHLVDYLPERTMARGNILGRIASLKKYLKTTLPERPGGREELTQEDRKRIRKEAEKAAKGDAYIDRVIKETLPVTPEDVLAIWNEVEKAKLVSPELYEFIALLNSAEKKAIVKAALKGELPEEIQRFAKVIQEKIVRDRVEIYETVTDRKGKKKKVYTKEFRKIIAKKYAELIEEEIKKLKLFKREQIMDELKKLTHIYKPFDPSANPKYTAYRYSGPELYADAISALINAPGLLRSTAPSFYDAFFNYFEKKPEVKAIYDAIMDDIRSGAIEKKRTERVFDMFRRGDDAYALSLQRRDSRLDALARDFIDANWMVLKKIKQVGERNVPAGENPRYKLEEMAYSGSEAEWYLVKAFRGMVKPLEKAGMDWDDFGFELYLRRVAGERAGYANPQGWTPDLAQRKLDELRGLRSQEQNRAIDTAIETFQELRNYVIDKAEKAGRWPQELIDKMRDTPEYATFDVVKYIEERWGRGPSASIYRQIGTFEDIANPATATILKDLAIIQATNRQIAAESVVKFMKKHYPDEIRLADTKWNGRYHEIKPPPKGQDLGLIVYLKNGRPEGYYVHKWIADIFERNPIEGNALAHVLSYTAQFFRSIFTEFNPGFQLFNTSRDFWRGYFDLPQAKLLEWLAAYMKGIRPAFRSVYGIPDPVVEQMLKGNTLISVADFRGQGTQDREIARLLKRFHFTPLDWNKNILAPFGHFLTWFGNVGRAIERIPKIGAYHYLRKKFPDMPPELVGHLIRCRAGSPAFLTRGRMYPLYNNILLFSNAFKEGYRGDYEAFSDAPGEFMWKRFKYAVIPKVLMWAASMGLLGAGVKAIMDGASEYDKTNYIIIPLGLTETGKSVYLRVPLDESNRLVGGILWKMLSADAKEMTTGLFDYMAGQAPTIHPGVDMLISTVQYASGLNPYDFFRGRYAIPEQIFEAGGKRKHEAFIKWLANKSGSTIVYRFKYDDVGRIKTELEEVLGYPFVSNIVGRFVKVTDQGIKETIKEMKFDIRQANTRKILDAKDALNKMLRGEGLDKDEVLAVLEKPDIIDRNLMVGLARKYGMIYLEEWMNAQSNEEKTAVLKALLERKALMKEKEK